MRSVALIVPVKTRNELNGNYEHWTVKNRRRAEVKEAVGYALLAVDWRGVAKPTLEAPWTVTLTRLTPYPPRMDDDGVVSSLKSVRDAVAKFVGVDDKRKELVRYVYDEAKDTVTGVRIEITVGQAMQP